MTEREMARKKAAARKARKERERKARNRRVVMTVALMLVVCVASIGGTIAWLTDKSEVVTNTFSPSGIDISLTETPNADGDDEDTANDHWEAQLVPGKEYSKDPEVSVDSTTNVDVWLFVKVEEGAKAYLDYDLTLDDDGSGWTQGSGTTIPVNVWYREVKTTDANKEWTLLKDNKVVVKSTLTKDNMPGNSVTMNFTAYSIQTHGFSEASSAWSEVSKLDNASSDTDTDTGN